MATVVQNVSTLANAAMGAAVEHNRALQQGNPAARPGQQPEGPRAATAIVTESGKPEGQDKSGNSNDLQKAVDEANQHLQALRRNLQFSVDEDSGQTVIKVVDTDSEEVIRQIPPEEILNISRSLQKIEGVLFDAEA